MRSLVPALVLAALWTACAPAPAPADPATGPAAHAPMEPPFVGSLSATVDQGVTELSVTIDVAAPLPVPMRIEFAGAGDVIEGEVREIIASPKPGRVLRTWRVRGTFDTEAPAIVTVRQLDGERAGALTTLRYPPVPQTPTTKFAPHAPARVGGVPINATIKVPASSEVAP